MPSGAVSLGGQIGDVVFGATILRQGTNRHTAVPDALAAGLAGTLSTRTDDNTGILTVETGHGVEATHTVAVFWDGGSRRGVDVTAVGATTISIDLGTGDNLPLVTTAIVVSREYTINMDFTGDEVISAAVQADRRCNVEFQEGDATPIVTLELGGQADDTEDFWQWHGLETGGTTNPFAGVDNGKVVISNGSSAGTTTIKIGVATESVA